MTHISAQQLNVKLGDDFALHDINFDIQSGDLVGIVGPNGSGKTTLLRAISGALNPTSGTVKLNETCVQDLEPSSRAKMMAVVAQQEQIHFPFTAGQVCLLGRSPYLSGLGFESSLDREIVKSAMQSTGVFHLADRTFSTLSGGEKKRVTIARALAQEPEVLLLDEPLASLDLKHQVQVFKLLKQCAKEGMAIAVVLHDLNQAIQWCNRAYLLNRGNVVAHGQSADVLVPETIETAFGIAVKNVARDTAQPFYTP